MTAIWRSGWIGMLMVLTLATPTFAEDPPSVAAKQVAGLFMQSCLRFDGDKDGLRLWARKVGLTELPPGIREHFLRGLTGVVFDASNQAGKFALLSDDGGSCSAVAQMASGPLVITDLEKDMTDAGISSRLTAEKGDTEEKALTHREYAASKGAREWVLQISIVKDGPGQAMLTTSR